MFLTAYIVTYNASYSAYKYTFFKTHKNVPNVLLDEMTGIWNLCKTTWLHLGNSNPPLNVNKMFSYNKLFDILVVITLSDIVDCYFL